MLNIKLPIHGYICWNSADFEPNSQFPWAFLAIYCCRRHVLRLLLHRPRPLYCEACRFSLPFSLTSTYIHKVWSNYAGLTRFDNRILVNHNVSNFSNLVIWTVYNNFFCWYSKQRCFIKRKIYLFIIKCRRLETTKDVVLCIYIYIYMR